MAIPNRKPSNPNNFFTRNIQKHGDNFIDMINARDMQMGAISVFRDLAKGNIDINKYGIYFLDSQLLENFLSSACAKLALHSINLAGVNLLVSQTPNPDVSVLQILDFNKKSTTAYEIIVKGLSDIKYSRDLNHLYVLVNNLKEFRFNI